jgi:hypothetical protein
MHQHVICQQINDVLKTHLIEQIFVQESVKNRLSEVTRALSASDVEVPKCVMDFALALHDSGLLSSSVSNITSSQILDIANYLNSGNLSALGAQPSTKKVPMSKEEKARLTAAGAAIEAAFAAKRETVAEAASVFTNVSPPVIHDSEWLDTSVPPTAEFFDGLNDTGMALRRQHRDMTAVT